MRKAITAFQGIIPAFIWRNCKES